MTVFPHRASEALFIVIIRENLAEQKLRSWAESNNAKVTIESNRMKIYEHHSLNLFQISWKYDWKYVTIWDCWNKRHVSI